MTQGKIALGIGLAVIAAVLILASGLAGHAISPTVRVRSVPTTLPPSTMTVTATATATATATVTTTKIKRVVVPSPVLVTVSAAQPQMTELEARAYCENLASQAWPPPAPTGDPTLDQIGKAYADMQRDRAFNGCMTEHGY